MTSTTAHRQFIPDYLAGPYQFGPTPGRVALLAAAIALVAGPVDVVRRQFRGEFGWTGEQPSS